MKIPKLIPIMRWEDYHTHYLGKTQDGKLFWGYETFVFPKGHPTNELENKRRDYIVLHVFDKTGTYLTTDYYFEGLIGETPSSVTEQKLEEMVAKLGNVVYCDIKVKLFQTEIDGFIFGLIPDEENEVVNLEPSSTISFSAPWDGEYDT